MHLKSKMSRPEEGLRGVIKLAQGFEILPDDGKLGFSAFYLWIKGENTPQTQQQYVCVLRVSHSRLYKNPSSTIYLTIGISLIWFLTYLKTEDVILKLFSEAHTLCITPSFLAFIKMFHHTTSLPYFVLFITIKHNRDAFKSKCTGWNEKEFAGWD